MANSLLRVLIMVGLVLQTFAYPISDRFSDEPQPPAPAGDLILREEGDVTTPEETPTESDPMEIDYYPASDAIPEGMLNAEEVQPFPAEYEVVEPEGKRIGGLRGRVDWGMDTVVAPSLDTFFRMYSGPVARATGAAADGIFSNVGGNIASYYAQKKALEAK